MIVKVPSDCASTINQPQIVVVFATAVFSVNGVNYLLQAVLGIVLVNSLHHILLYTSFRYGPVTTHVILILVNLLLLLMNHFQANMISLTRSL